MTACVWASSGRQAWTRACVGAALCMAAMHAMAAKGYAYSVIGWVGPADFYAKLVGATMIEDSTPGMYKDMLKPS